MPLIDSVWVRRSALGLVLASMLASACGSGSAASRPTATPASPLATQLLGADAITLRQLLNMTSGLYNAIARAILPRLS